MKFVVQHHPSRADSLQRVLAALPTAAVVTDPIPHGKRSAWRTYRACLELADGPLCIVQDDAIPVPGFEGAVEVASKLEPEALIAFFHQGFPKDCSLTIRAHLSERKPFWELPRGRYVPTVALFWPEGAPERFLDWAEKVRKVRPDFLGDDSLVGDWTRYGKQRALVTVPSLVEHPDDTPSLTKRYVGNPRTAVALAAHASEWISLSAATAATVVPQ